VAFLDEFEGVHLNYYSKMNVDVELEDGSVEPLHTYVMDNFNEETFLNESTIFFDDYTEKNGIFGEYRHRSKIRDYNMEEHLRQVKKQAF